MAQKLYRIGDAAELLGLETHVLRYWETEFSQLRPVRTGKGQRRYTEADMAVLVRIRYLRDQGLTIEGTRRVLTGEFAFGDLEGAPSAASSAPVQLFLDDRLAGAKPGQAPVLQTKDRHSEAIRRIADELRSLLRLLRQDEI